MRTLFSVLVGTDSNDEGVYYKEIAGISSETKPTAHISVGSIFEEVDTGDVYQLNESTGEWVKEFSLQG